MRRKLETMYSLFVLISRSSSSLHWLSLLSIEILITSAMLNVQLVVVDVHDSVPREMCSQLVAIKRDN